MTVKTILYALYLSCSAMMVLGRCKSDDGCGGNELCFNGVCLQNCDRVTGYKVITDANGIRSCICAPGFIGTPIRGKLHAIPAMKT